MPELKLIVIVKQYSLPGGHDEIRAMIQKLEKAQILCPTHNPYNALVCPVKKPDGLWGMNVDYPELNKVTSPLHGAEPFTHDLINQLTIRLIMYHYVLDLPIGFSPQI